MANAWKEDPHVIEWLSKVGERTKKKPYYSHDFLALNSVLTLITVVSV